MTDSSPSVLILGGGVAGLSAADYLNSCGVSVHLVEKSDHLGGKAHDWACMATDKCRNCGACLSTELVDRVGRLENVSVILESSVAKITRQKEGFKATVSGKETFDLTASAVLIATGMSLYDPAEQADLGYSEHDNVITTAELNTALKQEQLEALLPENKHPAIAFIQCIGSRNREKGRDYCSRVCCKTSIRQANKIMHKIPGAAVSIFNIDLQATGKEFRSQVATAAEKVQIFQGTPAKILDNVHPGKLTIIHEDGIASRVAHHFDLVVLAVGILPAHATGAIAGMLDIKTDDWGFLGQDGSALPAGVYTAGVAGSPTGILAAIGQGKTSAHRIALALGRTPDNPKDRVAVFGGDDNAGRIAVTLAERGYPAVIIDSGSHAFPEIPNVEHYPFSRLTQVAGTVGNYSIRIESRKGRQTLSAGAIVVAPAPELRPAAAVGTAGQVIETLSSFLTRYNRKDALPESVLFWLDHNGPERKNFVESIMQVVPELAASGKKITILMEKMLVNYDAGQRIYDTVRNRGVKLLRVTDQQQVALSSDGKKVFLTVNEATLPGMTLSLECDLLVIPERAAASETGHGITRLLRQQIDAEGFLQSANVRHRNVGSPRRGIYFAGFSHDEGDLNTEIDEISAALAISAEGGAGTSQPVINEGACVRCLTCVRVCPHCAVILKNHYQPEIDPKACFGCNLCVSNCPAVAIGAPEILETGSSQTVVFACERSAALAAHDINLPDDTRLVSVPCACSIDTSRILHALLNGAGRIVIAACHDGNCRSMKGITFATASAQKLIQDTGIPEAKLSCLEIAANEPARLKKMIANPASVKEVN